MAGPGLKEATSQTKKKKSGPVQCVYYPKDKIRDVKGDVVGTVDISCTLPQATKDK
ncbi:unnamed protein product [Sphenostylis stenocarpa]|uniref:Uncharacterized protein n=1 Tax=Sphenostylis stenocarpa TaxID=92480 RepID=A0AA86VKQ8_9FABA|nr:unnamed protein product [Sphenostylis stenocarpa]